MCVICPVVLSCLLLNGDGGGGDDGERCVGCRSSSWFPELMRIHPLWSEVIIILTTITALWCVSRYNTGENWISWDRKSPALAH